MGTTKHTRNSGATTVKKDGKIVGNIGRGKNKVPTVQKMTTTHAEEQAEQTSSLTKASQRFSTLTETVDYSTAQTLWNLTIDKPYNERLNMLGYYIDSLEDDDRSELLAQIEDEVTAEDGSKKWGKKTERMIQFESALANDASISSRYGVPLNVLQHFAEEPSTRWDDVIAANKDTTLEILTLLAEKKDKSTPLHKANNLMLIVQHDNATPELVTKIYENTNDTYVYSSIAESSHTPQNILEELSRHSSIVVRQQVIKNPNTPIEILHNMSNDVDLGLKKLVREHIADRNWAKIKDRL